MESRTTEQTVLVYAVLSTVALTCIFFFTRSGDLKSKFLKSQSWVGRQKELFSFSRATLRSITGSSSMLAEGYEKV